MTAAFAILRPFVILAACAFVVGVFGYLALGQPSRAVAQLAAQPAPQAAATSGPASEDWNLPHHI